MTFPRSIICHQHLKVVADKEPTSRSVTNIDVAMILMIIALCWWQSICHRHFSIQHQDRCSPDCSLAQVTGYQWTGWRNLGPNRTDPELTYYQFRAITWPTEVLTKNSYFNPLIWRQLYLLDHFYWDAFSKIAHFTLNFYHVHEKKKSLLTFGLLLYFNCRYRDRFQLILDDFFYEMTYFFTLF